MASLMSRTNIKEANEHLQQLHHTVFELENRVQLQDMNIDELQKSNAELQRQLWRKEKDVVSRDRLISELTEQLKEKEEQLQKLLSAAELRDNAMILLEAKSRLFHEAVEHKSALIKILEVLEEVSSQQTQIRALNGTGHSKRTLATSSDAESDDSASLTNESNQSLPNSDVS